MEKKATSSKSVFKPVLRRFSTGELIMRASPAAAAYVVPPKTAARPFLDALTVSSNARLRVKALGGPAAVRERQNVLAMHILQFGKYRGQTFKWLLENDLGWVTGVVAVIEYKDKEIPNNAHSANKFRLVEYVRMYPEVTHHMLEKKKIVAEKERQKVEAPKVSIPSQTAPRPSPSAEDNLKDEDLVEEVTSIETIEAISGDVVYSAWKQVLDPCDLKWISKALFRVNRQGKAEMCFDNIDKMWFHPPKPALVCSKPPAMDRYFARPIFLWMPKKLWKVRLTCPGKDCNGQELISSGIYRTLRRVLSLSGFYYMAAEYLECSVCKKKLSSWNQDLLDQLDVGHRLQFPCILTRLMACDLEVVKMLRQRGLGNSVARLRQNLAELHGEENLKRTAHYLSDCQTFSTAQKRGLVTRTVFTPPPTPPRIPSCQWLTSVYCQDVLSRLEEVKAAITSVYGRILKVDSTKKVAKKLQGSAAETAAWATNVGNEHGQVLMSVLTAGEGAGLDSMFEGIQRRYEDANVNPPEVVYVDRDCCGPNFIGKKFESWSATQVRLDIWHFMRRISSACTTESHALYPQFMRRLSGCIFYWSEEDLAALKLAKETQAMKEGVTVQGKEQEWLTKKELALHCRRTTRSPVEIRQQINELLEVFSGEQGRDMLGTPLLDADKARDVWESQQRHVDCIQDPPNVSLYTQTGTLKKGTKTLPTYRCARGST